MEPAVKTPKEPADGTPSTGRLAKRKRKTKTKFFEEQCNKMNDINKTLQQLVALKTEANNIAKEKPTKSDR